MVTCIPKMPLRSLFYVSAHQALPRSSLPTSLRSARKRWRAGGHTTGALTTLLSSKP